MVRRKAVYRSNLYEWNLLVLLKSQVIHCVTEDRQSNGQADIAAIQPCDVYVFVLKADESADTALEQVKAIGYDAPYRGGNAPVWLVKLSFDSKMHRQLDAKAERL